MTAISNELRQLAADTHVIILAAGLGTRLKENTQATPKCLVPVSGQPILERMLENLAALGVRRASIVVGYLDQAIRQFVGAWLQEQGQGLEVDFVLNERYAQSGSVLSLELALREADAECERQHLLLIEGDVVTDRRLLQRLLEQGVQGAEAATMLAPYEPALNGTFATVDGGVVSAWLHESVREPGFELQRSFKTVNLSFVRRGTPRQRLLARVSGEIARAGVKAPLEYAMHALVLEGLQIRAVLTDGLPWFEVDTPEDLAIANAMFPPLAVAA
ncbi:phosphocholine cytidylyltransferase family protein [Azohydromonas caseinilytica]|uniref:Phosphocholine cytidylyltransferase family protein n=1 Tax=Azohydromonas caseinilytica TaxID=2728836 RepID=A0A848FBH4_9BURK|nr:phosphocholine cytidylyltransferase family protein [Azohydromonas caseinilytica]NML16085.1 phosphocholine cytidylyltransferase family protein [Azohydromonas caseinilytica]